MITIHFDRGAGHATVDGLRAWGADAWQEMCRSMLDIGLPDDEAVVIDERGTRCWTIASVHKTARYYLPTDAEAKDQAAKRDAEKARKKLEAPE